MTAIPEAIVIQVELEALPGQVAGFAELLQRTALASAAEPGCLIYRFGRDLTEETRFHLTELWQSQADLLGHVGGPAFKQFVAELPELGKVISSQTMIGPLRPHVLPRGGA